MVDFAFVSCWPRGSNNQDIYEEHISQSIAGEDIVFIDSWYYHIRNGEIHCGTNVLRTIPDEP